MTLQDNQQNHTNQQTIQHILELPHPYIPFSKSERTLLKVYLLHLLYQGACQQHQTYYSQYLKFLKNTDQEDDMIDNSVIRFLINDIISTEEYNLEGIAYYVRAPLDAIMDLVTGININPSLALSTKIIELHTTVRQSVYGEIIKKLLERPHEESIE